VAAEEVEAEEEGAKVPTLPALLLLLEPWNSEE